jgi:hypothetical protein
VTAILTLAMHQPVLARMEDVDVVLGQPHKMVAVLRIVVPALMTSQMLFNQQPLVHVDLQHDSSPRPKRQDFVRN